MEITVDLERQRVAAGDFEASFTLDPFYRECLLNGWDEVALTLRHEDDIARFESGRPAWLPVAG
jgi:3-isopropylmalate/(R)-2-methylmalate dehydratase small subunit